MKANIIIKLGANTNSVTVDGHVFDRSTMKQPEQRKLRRMTVAGLKQSGYFEGSRA